VWLRYPVPELDRVWGKAQQTLASASGPFHANPGFVPLANDTTRSSSIDDSSTTASAVPSGSAARGGQLASQGWDTMQQWWVQGQHVAAKALADLRPHAPWLRLLLMAGLGLLGLACLFQSLDRLRQRVVMRHLEAALGAALGQRAAPGARRRALLALNAATLCMGLLAALLFWLQVDRHLELFARIHFGPLPWWRPGWILPALILLAWALLLLVVRKMRYRDQVFLAAEKVKTANDVQAALPQVTLEGRMPLAQRAPGSPLLGLAVDMEGLPGSRGLLQRLSLLHGMGLLKEVRLAPGGAWTGVLKWTEAGRTQSVEQAPADQAETEGPAVLPGLDPKALVRLLCRAMYLTAQAGGRAVGTRQNRVFSHFCLNHSVSLLLTKSELLDVLKALPKDEWSYLGGEEAAALLLQERGHLKELPTVREYCHAWTARGHRSVTEEWPRAARDDFDPMSNGVFQDLNMSVARLFDLLVEAVAFSDHALNDDEQAILVALGKGVEKESPANISTQERSALPGDPKSLTSAFPAEKVSP